MLRQLWRWFTEVDPDPEPKPRVIERFGAMGLDASSGLSLLSEPPRQRLCQDIRESLMHFPLEERGEYVDRLLLRFAFYVLDLPASESHHHSVRFGLLDHSLDVACRVAKAVGSPAFRTTEDYAADYHQKPIWHYAAVVCALLHDVGKILDLEVSSPDGKDCWDPFAEPLALFCGRHRLGQTGPERWKHRVGRGMRYHAWHGPMLYPLILPPKPTPYLGHRLAQLSDALIAQTLDRAPEATPDVPARIAAMIHQADVEGSKADRHSAAWTTTEPVEVPTPQEPAAIVRPAPVPEAVRAPSPSPALAAAAAPDPAPAPASAPEENEPFVIPIQCPPLDLGVVLKDFMAALRAAVEQGVIPLNKDGGLYVGRKHVYLHYPDGMERVIDLMMERGSDLEDRMEEDCAANPERSRAEFTPEGRVFRALLAGKRMPFSSDTMLWVQQGTVVPPEGEPIEGQVVLMDLPFPDYPRFKGKLDLYGIGDPESDQATNPFVSPPKKPSIRLVRSQEETYSMRVDAELRPARLLATLTDALRSGVFHRRGSWSPVYIRPDFTWVLVPGTFKVLLPRMAIPFTGDLENRVLQSLQEMPELARGEDGRAIHRIKVHPESQDSVWAIALDTRRLLTVEQIAALGVWECPIRVVEGLPGEYAA